MGVLERLGVLKDQLGSLQLEDRGHSNAQNLASSGPPVVLGAAVLDIQVKTFSVDEHGFEWCSYPLSCDQTQSLGSFDGNFTVLVQGRNIC